MVAIVAKEPHSIKIKARFRKGIKGFITLERLYSDFFIWKMKRSRQDVLIDIKMICFVSNGSCWESITNFKWKIEVQERSLVYHLLGALDSPWTPLSDDIKQKILSHASDMHKWRRSRDFCRLSQFWNQFFGNDAYRVFCIKMYTRCYIKSKKLCLRPYSVVNCWSVCL